MASNKLMEAAAEILANSKKTASAMPPQKLGGEVQDLGGPTPQNAKPDDDSHKIHAGEKASDNSAKNKSTISTKPSHASPDTQNHVGRNTMHEEEDREDEDQDQLHELSKSTLGSYIKNASFGPKSIVKRAGDIDHAKDDDDLNRKVDKYYNRHRGINKAADRLSKEDTDYSDYDLVEELRNQMHDDMQALFSEDETISEEFKSKAATIFEARVLDRVSQIEEEMEVAYAGMLEEAIDSIKADLTEKVDDYLNYVVEQWMEENQIAIQSGLRSEITEEFIVGLRNLFAEHYIDVPEDKVDLVDELAGKVEELEDQLDEEIKTNIEYRKAILESVKRETVYEVCKGLTETQVEKMKSLAESVDFSTEEELEEKLETIRENYFPSNIKKADETQLHEQVSDEADDKKAKVSFDPIINAVVQSISKTKI